MTDAATENAYLRARLADAERRVAHLTRETTASERDEMSAAWSRADAVARLYGTTASQPVPGESSTQYRRRLLQNFKQHSARFANADMTHLPASAIPPVEDAVFHDAAAAAHAGTGLPPGKLVPITTREGGRDVTRFTGDPMGWMAPFMRGGQVGRFVQPPGNAR